MAAPGVWSYRSRARDDTASDLDTPSDSKETTADGTMRKRAGRSGTRGRERS